VAAPVRHGIELNAVRELHLFLVEQTLELVAPAASFLYRFRSFSSLLGGSGMSRTIYGDEFDLFGQRGRGKS
jgi:hypothetical protein